MVFESLNPLQQCGHFSDKGEGVLQMWTSALFDAKKLWIFRNLWFVRTRWKGLSQCRQFADKGEGSIFCNFVRTSFMDGPLWKIKTLSREVRYLGIFRQELIIF